MARAQRRCMRGGNQWCDKSRTIFSHVSSTFFSRPCIEYLIFESHTECPLSLTSILDHAHIHTIMTWRHVVFLSSATMLKEIITFRIQKTTKLGWMNGPKKRKFTMLLSWEGKPFLAFYFGWGVCPVSEWEGSFTTHEVVGVHIHYQQVPPSSDAFWTNTPHVCLHGNRDLHVPPFKKGRSDWHTVERRWWYSIFPHPSQTNICIRPIQSFIDCRHH